MASLKVLKAYPSSRPNLAGVNLSSSARTLEVQKIIAISSTKSFWITESAKIVK